MSGKIRYIKAVKSKVDNVNDMITDRMNVSKMENRKKGMMPSPIAPARPIVNLEVSEVSMILNERMVLFPSMAFSKGLDEPCLQAASPVCNRHSYDSVLSY